MPTVSIGFEDGPDVRGRDSLVRFGPTLYVSIGFDPTYSPDGPELPNLPDRQYPALVDTGALESCIDSTLAIDLDLPIADRQVVSGVHGASEVNFHLAQIYVPEFGAAVYGRFAGVHLISGGQRHLALIGRSFLQNFMMTYDGRTGAVTLSTD